jgi:Ca2+-binding EF-hand superfamily protein
MNALGCDSTDEELIAIVRRIDSSGNGTLEYFEFKVLCEPIILKMADI